MGKSLFAIGHGTSRSGDYDPGAHGNGTTEAAFLRGSFLSSLKKYAKGHAIDFYEQNMYANKDAKKITGYGDVIELHLDAASAAARGGHVIIHEKYQPDAMDKRLGKVIQDHFGLRGGKMFDGRDNLYNLNVFADRGVSYRLLELGFITNKSNMDHFKANYDQIARELIEAIINKKISVPETPKPDAMKPEGEKLMNIPQWQREELAKIYSFMGEKGVFNKSKEHEDAILNGTMTEQQAIVLQTIIAGAAFNGGKRI